MLCAAIHDAPPSSKERRPEKAEGREGETESNGDQGFLQYPSFCGMTRGKGGHHGSYGFTASFLSSLVIVHMGIDILHVSTLRASASTQMTHLAALVSRSRGATSPPFWPCPCRCLLIGTTACRRRSRVVSVRYKEIRGSRYSHTQRKTLRAFYPKRLYNK